MSTNGTPPQSIANPSHVVVLLAPMPGMLGVNVTCYPDPRGAPNPAAAMQSMLVLAVINSQAHIAALIERVAVLEIMAAESARPLAVDVVGSQPPPNDRARDVDRLALATAAVVERADTIGITAPAPAEPASALDGVKLD